MVTTEIWSLDDKSMVFRIEEGVEGKLYIGRVYNCNQHVFAMNESTVNIPDDYKLLDEIHQIQHEIGLWRDNLTRLGLTVKRET